MAKSFNDKSFNSDEKLFRAVYPPEISDMFWRRDGSLSSAAFADPKGLSVDRQGDRTVEESARSMMQRFTGNIVYVRFKSCKEIGATVKYLPSTGNPYHSEIHGSDTVPLLSKSQRRYLSRKAVLI